MYPSPIVITGANGQVGRGVLAAIAGTGVAVTALVRTEQSLPGATTIADWLTVDAAKAAIGQAAAVVHLAGTLNPPDHDYERANVLPTERLVGALDNGRTRQVVYVSYVGASEVSANAYLRTKARAERMLWETGIPLAAFRCPHIIGSRHAPGPTAGTLLRAGRRSVPLFGNGKQRVAPVFLGDVVAAILGALRSGLSGNFDLQGPDTMTMDELVRLLNADDDVRITHLPRVLAGLLRFVGPKLPVALIDLMTRDSISDQPTVPESLGVRLTPLCEAWRGTG